MPEDVITLVSQCKKFFGLKEGETLPEFLAEFKQLTPQDKQELVDLFNAAGMPTKLNP